jgi:hypothetical protein
MSHEAQDRPNVIVLPPVLVLATIALGVILEWLLPIGLLAALPAFPLITAGVILFVLGDSVPIAARQAFVKAGTSIRPDMPTTALSRVAAERVSISSTQLEPVIF